MASAPFVAATKLPPARVRAAEQRRRLEEAKAFLVCVLAAGPQPAKGLLKAAKTVGIAERTLHRAKDALGVTTARQGGYSDKGQWVWHPPCASPLFLGTTPLVLSSAVS